MIICKKTTSNSAAHKFVNAHLYEHSSGSIWIFVKELATLVDVVSGALYTEQLAIAQADVAGWEDVTKQYCLKEITK